MDTLRTAEIVKHNGGATLFHASGTIYQHKTPESSHFAWCVGINPPKGCENYEYQHADGHKITEYDIAVHLWKFMSQEHSNQKTFGVWIDPETNTVYIDFVVVTTKEDAVRIGTQRGEISVFNLVTEDLHFL